MQFQDKGLQRRTASKAASTLLRRCLDAADVSAQSRGDAVLEGSAYGPHAKFMRESSPSAVSVALPRRYDSPLPQEPPILNPQGKLAVLHAGIGAA